MKEVYALFGKPLGHSQSPRLHRAFASQLGREIEYRLIETDSYQLERAIFNFFTAGGRGANVTAPYKREIMPFLDQMSPFAATVGAVNTVTVVGGKLVGYNTDGVGFYRDILNKSINLYNKRVLILGSGGGAAAIKLQLKIQGFASINMLARDAKPICGDIIINATSAGLYNQIPDIAFKLDLRNTICYDCNYGQAANVFLQYAKAQGAYKIFNGWGMLVEQAAESFYKWTQFLPSTVEMHGASVT